MSGTRYNRLLTCIDTIKMDRLTKNRLIGGAVLLLTAVLFLPGILQPEASVLKNPDLAVHLAPKSTLSTSQDKRTEKMSPETPLVLESSKALSAQAGNDTTGHLMPITLESLPESNKKPSQLKHWLQIDAFNDELAALQAANKIRSKHLSTQIKVLSRDGIKTHQVLVGPFQSKQLTKNAMQTLSQLGYQAKLKQ